MASTVNDNVSAGTPVPVGKNSLPMLLAKNPKITKSNTSSAPPVLATRMVQRWCAVIDSFRIRGEWSSMVIPDVARHNYRFKRTPLRRDVFSHHRVKPTSMTVHDRSGLNMMDDNSLTRKVFRFALRFLAQDLRAP